MTPAEVLLAAADHCDATGLHKGELWPGAATPAAEPYREGDPCCLEGHVVAVTDPDPGAWKHYPRVALDALRVVEEYLMDAFGECDDPECEERGECDCELPAFRWSDAPERTAAEVSAALRAAAEVTS